MNCFRGQETHRVAVRNISRTFSVVLDAHYPEGEMETFCVWTKKQKPLALFATLLHVQVCCFTEEVSFCGFGAFQPQPSQSKGVCLCSKTKHSNAPTLTQQHTQAAYRSTGFHIQTGTFLSSSLLWPVPTSSMGTQPLLYLHSYYLSTLALFTSYSPALTLSPPRASHPSLPPSFPCCFAVTFVPVVESALAPDPWELCSSSGRRFRRALAPTFTCGEDRKEDRQTNHSEAT